ncbi:thiamine-phosphate kinase [Nonomuraea sp. 3N208]|uniref:thiamine-phosphate kinase n=1 Tax=Nonomuraea sp. 3N208 TaxID=3457421 RepID=UPI003FD000AB
MTTDDMTSLGEKGFLADLLPRLYSDPLLVGGFGHDASVIELTNAPFNLIQKIDRASHPVALKEGWCDHRTWGQMAVTANCSDILASGGQPIAFMMAVMVPGTENARDVQEIIFGAANECRANGVVYAGGDTKEAKDAHVVGTAIGIVAKDGFLPRNTAMPGDQIFCAGLIGGFAGAYFMLKRVPQDQRDRPAEDYIRYPSSPRAQWRVATEVNALKAARCGMDASDGILDVLQTFSSAGVQVSLNLDAIPYHPFALECARKTGVPLTQLIFGGGDWNILYCVSPERADELRKLGDTSFPLFHIGEVTSGSGVVARAEDGARFAVSGVVNEHFKSRIEDATDFMTTIETGNFLQ